MSSKRNRKACFNNSAIIREAKNFKPYDWVFLLKVELQMLHKMKQYFEQSNIIEEAPILVKNLKIGISLLKIVCGIDGCVDFKVNKNVPVWIIKGGVKRFNTEYTTARLTKYINTRNANRFSTSGLIDLLNSDKSGNVTVYCHEELRETKAWVLYNHWREQYLKTMWD